MSFRLSDANPLFSALSLSLDCAPSSGFSLSQPVSCDDSLSISLSSAGPDLSLSSARSEQLSLSETRPSTTSSYSASSSSRTSSSTSGRPQSMSSLSADDLRRLSVFLDSRSRQRLKEHPSGATFDVSADRHNVKIVLRDALMDGIQVDLRTGKVTRSAFASPPRLLTDILKTACRCTFSMDFYRDCPLPQSMWKHFAVDSARLDKNGKLKKNKKKKKG